jgi:putative transposase
VAKLSVRRQCALLSVGRSRLYYKPRPEKPENLKMMQIMDRHLTDHPTEGVISLVLFFVARNYPVGPKRIRRLLKLMGRQTIYRRKNLTKQGLKMFIKPYLLNGLSITCANQVWCTDITYIPMKHGFLYLTAIIDVYSRKIVGWGISNTMTAGWCKQVLEEAIATHGKPTIVNSDQGCQYTSALWTQYLEGQEYRFPWMAKQSPGQCVDREVLEVLKYDYVYLNPADDGFELYEGVQNHISYYMTKPTILLVIHPTTDMKNQSAWQHDL